MFEHTKLGVVASLLLAVCMGSATAADITWTGAGDGVSASDLDNWDLLRVPLSTDTIVLDGVAALGDNDMTWDYNGGGNGLPASVAAWTQDGYTGTATFPTTYDATFGTFTISGNATLNSGAWTHPSNSNAEVNCLRISVTGALSIGASGSIDVLGRGYSWLNNTGYGPGFSIGRSGAAHGGEGGAYADGTVSLVTYGSVTNPVSLGSGSGGRSGNAHGSSGGGAVRLDVGGTLTITAGGTIIADGAGKSDQSAAAGGSINISANAFSGSGSITVIGGTANGGRGAAGGGRIALLAGSGTPSQFDALALNARGGDGSNDGGAGTIYLKAPTQTYGSLVVKNNGVSTPARTIWTNQTLRFDSILTTNYGVLAVGSGGVLDFTDTELSSDSTSASISSRIILDSDNTNRYVFPTAFTNAGSLSQSGTNPIVLPGDLVVASGGVLTHEANDSTETDKLQLDVIGDVTVLAGGAISVDARGYGVLGGVGYGPGGVKGRAGAGHGGVGADADTRTGGKTYGSVLNPVSIGSGGAGRQSVTANGSPGGGAIIMELGGTLTVDASGAISADGGAVLDRSSGAGGSVNIAANAFSGTGSITAIGGTAWAGARGSSGGGRIALRADTGTSTQFDTLTVSASAGSGNPDGAAGTVYLQSGAEAEGAGTIHVDNAGLSINAQTELPPSISPVADELLGVSVTLDNAGAVLVTGDTNVWGGAFQIADAASALDLAGSTLTVLTFQDNDSAQVTTGSFTDNGSGNFDGVTFGGGTLNVSIPPEIETLAPSGIASTSADLIGQVLGTGDRSDVILRVYYGTTDETDSAGSWDSDELVNATAGIGVYTQSLSGSLTANTEYYYRFRGTDNANTNWGEPSQHFITAAITISATDNGAQEGVDTGNFEISRPGGLTSEDLTINYTISGSAGNGTDYSTIPSSVVIPAGQSSTNIVITPIVDGAEGAETVTLTLADGKYVNGGSSDTVTITDAPVTITWTGAGDGVNASDANNWDLVRVPLASDTIGLDGVAALGDNDITWDYNGGGNGLPSSVAVWNQDGYTGTVSFPTTYDATFPTFTITANATINSGAWTHPSNSNTEVNCLRISVTGALSIGASGSIDVLGRGYSWLNNTGYGPGFSIGRAGAAHGGEGSRPVDGTASLITYGSVTNPVNLGSGSGGRSGNTYGSSGGGAVLLDVGGTLTIAAGGTIIADGAGKSDQSAAAGGSISISANAFSGGGSLTAIGGTANTGRGAAGGGRVALTASTGTPAQFDTLTINARGGDGSQDGGAGTIFLKAPTQTYGSLVVRNNGASTPARTVWTNQTLRFDSILTTNYGVLAVGDGAVLNLTGTTLSSDSTSASITSYIQLDSENPGRYVFGSAFTNAGTLMQVGTNALPFPGNVVIASGGVWTHDSDGQSTTNEADRVALGVTGDLTVDAGGVITVKGRGYGGNNASTTVAYGPGASPGRSGASHGGQGGNGSGYTASDVTYGSVLNPTTYGSGSAGRSATRGSSGGGAIIITAGGTATLNGTLDADGDRDNDFSAAAGGSINISADLLAGSGVLRADGGFDTSNGGGGGGGRIALRADSGTDSQFSALTITAYGGNGGGQEEGGAGTVYLESGADGSGQGAISVDNAGQNINGYTLLPATQDAVAGELLKSSLSLANSGGVQFTATSTLGGDTTLADAGSQIDLAGYTVTVATFQDYNSAQVTSGTHTDNVSGNFDGVTFNGGTLIVSILPPDIETLAPSGIAATSADLIGEVLGTGDRSDVALRVYYGTSDGTNVATSWTSDELVDGTAAIGVYTQALSGTLTADTEYYYRYRGTDDSKTNWGEPSAYFITGDITISATDNTAQEGLDTGTFTISRPAGLDSEDLTVNYTISGTADNTTDYTTIASNVVISAGSDSATVLIDPIIDASSEGGETVTLTLAPGNYTATASSDTVTITDAPPTITWTGAGDGSSASDANNWTPVRVPEAADTINLDGVAALGDNDLTWDYNGGGNGLPTTVAVWNQDGYTGTVTFPTTYDGTFPVFTISGIGNLLSGSWTHTANTSTETYRLSVAVNGNANIDAGASIGLTGKGYSSSYGPGTTLGRGGASHGGQGGDGGSDNPSADGALVTYGSVTNPLSLGSGNHGRGFSNPGANGGPGGGAILLTVGGTLTHDGTIEADGVQTAGDNGAGAGGSINLTANAYAGSGTLSARGGTASSNGGSGGGGRIAIRAGSGTAAQFDSLIITAVGGTSKPGAAGTIYTTSPADTYGALIVDNGGSATTGITSWTNQTLRFDRILTTNYGVLAVGDGGVLDLSGTTLASDSTGDSITSRIRFGPETDRIVFPASFTLAGTLSQSGTGQHPVPGDLTVAAGGVLTHESASNQSSEDNRVNLSIGGSLTVDAAGIISVQGRGYGHNGSGTAYGPGASTGRGGAAHGGQGGDGADPAVNSLVTYGSILNPASYGSGCAGRNNSGSSGGGAVILTVTGTATIDGTIDADGDSNSDFSTGAGGTVNLCANQFAGSGVLRANGGDDTGNGGGGGGGRIALRANSGGATQFDSLTIAAFGGTGGGQQEGAAGTVYLQAASQGEGAGTVYVDNDGQNDDVYTGIPPHSDAVVGELLGASVTVTNGGSVISPTSTTIDDLLILSGSRWTLNANFLTVNQNEHSLQDPNVSGPGATGRVDNYAQIIWVSPATMYLLR